MGGVGSGNWVRITKVNVLEDYQSISIADLSRQNFSFAEGDSTRSIWTISSNKYLVIEIKVENPTCFSVDFLPGRKIENQLLIHFNLTPCNFGGNRAWFVCPHCVKNRSRLYFKNLDFQCGFCLNIPYRCQNEKQWDRLLRKREKISIKLGRTHEKKPPNMHWKTYSSLLNEYELLSEKASLSFLKGFE